MGTSLQQSNDVDTSNTRADEGSCVLGSGGARREDYFCEGTNQQTKTQRHIFCCSCLTSLLATQWVGVIEWRRGGDDTYFHSFTQTLERFYRHAQRDRFTQHESR